MEIFSFYLKLIYSIKRPNFFDSDSKGCPYFAAKLPLRSNFILRYRTRVTW